MFAKKRGPQIWALILCNASDQPAPQWPTTDYFNALIGSPTGGGLYTWWQQVSGGLVDFSYSMVFGWFTLPKTTAEIAVMSRSDLVAAARAAAKAAGQDVSSFPRVMAFATGQPGNGATGVDVATGVRATVGQPGWWHCRKCEGLSYWNGSRPPGSCIVSDRHDVDDSPFYSLPKDVQPANTEAGWRWCSKCEAQIFNTATPAPCPGGGTHDLSTSGAYFIHDNVTADNEQPGWKRCGLCQALAYWDSTRPPGKCPLSPNTGLHDHTGSANYSVPLAWDAQLGFLAHESGHALGLDHSFGTSRTGNLNDDSRPGAYGDHTDIMSYSGTAQFSVPRFTPAAAGLAGPTLYKLGWLADADAATVIAPLAKTPYTLRALYGGTGSSPRLLRIVEPSQGWIYTVEYRTPQGWDTGLAYQRVVVHGMRTLYQIGQDGWRHCTSCEGFVFAGQTICPAGGVHDSKGSGDYWLSTAPTPGQPNWRWCSKCSGLFYAGNPGSVCPAGGAHDGSASWNFSLASSGPGQPFWRWCSKCQGLAFIGNPRGGTCPAGGLHDTGSSGNYVLAPSGVQNKWRWCNKCQGLFYAGGGACKGDAVHHFDDNAYALSTLTGTSAQSGWRWCSKCFVLAFWDGIHAPGACTAGGTHDHTTSGNYVVPRDAENQHGERSWYRCANCSAFHYVDSTHGPGPCAAGGTHVIPSPQTEYIFAHDTVNVPGKSGFHRCSKCLELVFGDNPGGCAAGGNHATTASANYVVRTDPGPLMREQAFMRSCTKCSALFMLHGYLPTQQQPCGGGGVHNPAGEFFVTFMTGDALWRWCNKCQSMAYGDSTRPPGPCPAGGLHDHNGSGSYVPPSFANDVTQMLKDDLIAGATWVDDSGKITVEVVATDPNTASINVTAT